MWLKIDPGRYVIICWNKNHDKSTPVHSFTVKETGIPDDRPPKEDVVLKLFDYRFELNRALRKGTQVIRVETPGPNMHEVDIYRLSEGRTVEDLNRWRKGHETGASPAEALGGALDNHDIKRVVWLRKQFVPGRYVLHCEMPVTNTNLTHADVGMVREIEIKNDHHLYATPAWGTAHQKRSPGAAARARNKKDAPLPRGSLYLTDYSPHRTLAK